MSPAPAGSWFAYRAIRAVVHTYLWLYHRLRVEGRGKLPAEGGCLLVANHASFLDIPVVASVVRRHVSFVARESLTRSRFLDWLIRQCGAILIRPGESDRGALRAITTRLEQGCCVAIFPEGTRTADGSLGEFHGGALFAARRAGVPILPIGIQGTYEALSRRHRLPRPHAIRVRLGSPVDPAVPEADRLVQEAVARLTRAASTPDETPSVHADSSAGGRPTGML